MSSVIQTRHKRLLRDIRQHMRSQPVTQASISKAFAINQTLTSILMRELVSMGHIEKTFMIKNKGPKSTQAYELTESYLARLRPAEAKAKLPDEAAPSAPIATKAQAVLDLELAESTPMATEALIEAPVEAPAEVQAETKAQDPIKEVAKHEAPPPQEPERKSMLQHAIPSLAGVGFASICIWISQSLHHIPGLKA